VVETQQDQAGTTPESHNGAFHGEPEMQQEVSLLDTLQDQLKYQAQHRPYATVAAAMAVGYVLGGGVPWWAVRAAASIGSRVLVARVMAAVVEEP
jgi:hypothetical protein